MTTEDMRGLNEDDAAVLRRTAAHRKPHVVVFCAPASMLLQSPLDPDVELALDSLRDSNPLIAATGIDGEEMPAEWRVSAAELGTAAGQQRVEELKLAIAKATNRDGQTVHPVANYTEVDTRVFGVDLRVLGLLEAILSVCDDKEEQEPADDWRKLLEE